MRNSLKQWALSLETAPVYDQMAACASVVSEYRGALLYRLVDVDSYLEKFNEELKAAGLMRL